MRSYTTGSPSGRKIGEIDEYTLYEKTLVAQKPEPIIDNPKESDTTFTFEYGPSAGGLIEPILFNILTTGELIKCMSSDPMFKKRELKVRGKSVEEAMPLVERINGPFAASHSIAFLGAVEDALGIEPDRHVSMERIIEVELERIRNHLYVAGRVCEAAAFGVPYNDLFYLREKVNRLIRDYAGHRFFHGINRVGAVDASFAGVSGSLETLRKEVKNNYDSLRESKIFVDRLQANGTVKDPDCLGPVARGCGHPYDARADSDTLPYGELGFSPIVEKDAAGDVMDRFIVRFEEIFQSIELIRDAEKRLGERREIGPRLNKDDLRGIGRVESPSGDIAYLVELGNGKIDKIGMLTPSKVNLPVFLTSTRGNVFTDFHFNWESFGIWIAEIAVEML